MEFEISEATIDDIISISHQIPEFHDPYGRQEYEKRLKEVPFLALKAVCKGKDAGFKLGYEMNKDYFYSWFGGILPEYRQAGIAHALATAQEKWAKSKGYKFIHLKTRNMFKPMLIFALKNGFNILKIEEREDIREHRILLEKSIQ
ncbi:hypothetical protein C900_03671 [Fulvivirga imtechensis AK7]|uniref:N-acetyltransferase domain-containing protein n=2 Tax=Fulvivirga TaxID=396811 RepID=L8JT30_9BACT|nr:hypothetical protein C900_03671 [Fulvivirga imtechensis AK7]